MSVQGSGTALLPQTRAHFPRNAVRLSWAVASVADTPSAESTAADASGQPPPRPRGPVRPVFRRVERALFSDVYNILLAIPLGWLIVAVAAMFLATNAVFAGLYLLDPRGAAGVADYADAFFLSIQSICNCNRGFGAPSSDYARGVMTGEVFTGLLALARGTGLFFAKVSRPSARSSFSNAALISDYEGVPTLMFLVGNLRTNAILDAKVTINVAHQGLTREGQSIRRFDDAPAIKGSAPLFAYVWTIMHRIDQTSPLFGMDRERLADEHAEVIVVLSGVDDRFNQTVYARCSYTPDEIFFGRRFADVLSRRPDGRWLVDYSRFHDTVAA